VVHEITTDILSCKHVAVIILTLDGAHSGPDLDWTQRGIELAAFVVERHDFY
jgi:hypothetical protein